jgi:N-acetylmuramoyl-L-alanine amidase
MRMPFDGQFPISQRFGSNAGAYARFGMKGHNGLDFGCLASTPLKAVRDGVITERENDPTGYGLYAVLSDNEGTQWLYGHGSQWDVRKGDRVSEGQRIGMSGNSGNSTGPHLHFARRAAGYDRNNGYLGYTNPRPFLPLPYKVLIQAGHYPAGGGAPGEAQWTWRLAQTLRTRLEAAGLWAGIIGDFYTGPSASQAAILAQDYDLFLSLHYDAAIYGQTTGNSGCCAARGSYETEWWEADRFLSHWLSSYPAKTGIPLHQERVGPNMTQYYAYRHLSYVTPGIVLEHGVGAPGAGLDAPYLHDKLGEVAAVDAVTILRYLDTSIPMESKLMAILTPDERYEAINKVWSEVRGVPAVRENGFYKSWEENLVRDGEEGFYYRGLPIRGEMGTTFGTVQPFDNGVVVWKDGLPVSWSG